jgi:hypothetical protein
MDGGGTGGAEASGTGGNGAVTGGNGTADSADFSVDVISFVFSSTQVMRPYSPPIGEVADSSCVKKEAGDCVAAVCPIQNPSAIDYQHRHAGEVTASMNAETQTISAVSNPAANGKYTITPFSPGGRLLGEETGVVSAVGGDVGAFSQEVVFPLLLLATNPVVPGAGGHDIEVSRASDFTLTWERGAEGISYLIQAKSGAQTETHQHRLNCQFNSSIGAGVISEELLSLMPVGMSLDTFTAAEYERSVGEDLVRVRVVTEVTVPAKDLAVRLLLVD